MKKIFIALLLTFTFSIPANAEIIVPNNPLIFEQSPMYKENEPTGGEFVITLGNVYSIGAIYSSAVYDTYVVEKDEQLIAIRLYFSTEGTQTKKAEEIVKELQLFNYWNNKTYKPDIELSNRAALGFPKMNSKTLDRSISLKEWHPFLIVFRVPKDEIYNSLFLMSNVNKKEFLSSATFQLPKAKSIENLME